MIARLLSLLLTVVVGVFVTILIANMGGYVDKIKENEIRESTVMRVAQMTANKPTTPETKAKLVAEITELERKKAGLDKPIIERYLTFLKDALTLKLGRAQYMVSDHGSKVVKDIIVERLPATLLLMATSELLLFFTSLFLALSLSRHYGSFWDKLVIALSPTSSIPPWFYGIFLILIFAAVLRVLPFGGMVATPVPQDRMQYFLSLLKHLILPVSALFFSSFFLSVYGWRTFFLIFSSEDYVDMAKAKGLNSRDVERRYILRPTLPNIITNFAFLLIGLWSGAILTETVFQWPGLGRTLFRAVGFFDTAVIVGFTVIHAYLLAVTVFILDFVYAIVDPRVKIGGGNA